MKTTYLAGLAIVVAMFACSQPTAGGGGGSPQPPNFDAACDSSDTAKSSTLFCVRIDSRNGDIVLVDLAKLPVSNGPTKSAHKRAGAYRVFCDSTTTSIQSDFRCVRLDTITGEMMMVRLPKLGRYPN